MPVCSVPAESEKIFLVEVVPEYLNPQPGPSYKCA